MEDDLIKMTEKKPDESGDDSPSKREERQRKREEDRGDGFQPMDGVEEQSEKKKIIVGLESANSVSHSLSLAQLTFS